PTGLVFSQDGSTVYLSEQFSGGFVISALDANNLHLTGRAPDFAVAGIGSQLEEADATKLLFAIANRGVSFVDPAVSPSLAQAAPSFAAVPVAQPSNGPNAGGTSTTLSGSNLGTLSAIQFGSQSASVQSTTSTQIEVTSPASASSGPVNITAFFQNGW